MTERRQQPSRKRPTRAGVAAKEMQAARRKKRQREVLRNRILFCLFLVLILLLIIFGATKLIMSLAGSGRAPEVSTLTINADNSIVFEEIADFDEEVYSKSDLKNTTTDLIESFNEAYGDDAITLDKLAVKDDMAYLKTTYIDADAYEAFTTYGCFTGSVEDAIDAGYDFATTFSQVVDGEKLDATNMDHSTAFAGLDVAIIRENVTVEVPGIVQFVSVPSTEIVSKDTVAISQRDGNADAFDTVYIIYSREN